jgi:hypothetical protein
VHGLAITNHLIGNGINYPVTIGDSDTIAGLLLTLWLEVKDCW